MSLQVPSLENDTSPRLVARMGLAGCLHPPNAHLVIPWTHRAATPLDLLLQPALVGGVESRFPCFLRHRESWENHESFRAYQKYVHCVSLARDNQSIPNTVAPKLVPNTTLSSSKVPCTNAVVAPHTISLQTRVATLVFHPNCTPCDTPTSIHHTGLDWDNSTRISCSCTRVKEVWASGASNE